MALQFILPTSVLRDERPQRCEINEYAVISKGVPEGCDPLHLFDKPPEFFDERLLRRECFPVIRVGLRAKFTTKCLKTTFLMRELRHRVVRLSAEQIIRR
jgi:hypothetical protein